MMVSAASGAASDPTRSIIGHSRQGPDAQHGETSHHSLADAGELAIAIGES